jgi:SM-20-related protein
MPMPAEREDSLDYSVLEAAPVMQEPFAYLVAENAIRPSQLHRIMADFPDVPGPGSHPPSQLKIGGAFAEFMQELDGERFRHIVETKFGLSLEDLPTMYTVRGHVRRSDGSIHTDSKTKVITVLVYLNEDWSADGGRLRLLRNGHDLEDYVAEVPPHAGTILVFRRSDNSWHGHHPFEGPRRAIQMNWVVDPGVVAREQRRHAFSTRLKKVQALFHM